MLCSATKTGPLAILALVTTCAGVFVACDKSSGLVVDHRDHERRVRRGRGHRAARQRELERARHGGAALRPQRRADAGPRRSALRRARQPASRARSLSDSPANGVYG